jgi:hypothetical protein
MMMEKHVTRVSEAREEAVGDHGPSVAIKLRFSLRAARYSLEGLIVVCFGRLWVRGLAFPNARHMGRPFQWKNTLPWHPGPAAKVRILRFKNLPPFRHDPGLQIPRLRYSPGLAPTTRLNALLNAASDS